MSRPTPIETPFPTLRETAEVLGVSVSQAERVRKLLTLAKRNGRVRAKGMSKRAARSRYAAKKAAKRA